MTNIDGKVSIRVDEWLEWHDDEWFTPDDIIKFYGWQEAETKKAVYNRLFYLKTKDPATLKKVDRRYRIIDREANIIDWKGASKDDFVDIKLPFNLHDYIRLHRRSVMVVGGVSNEGKTTFAHNIVSLNWQEHPIRLLDSENSAEELAGRFCHYPDFEQWPDDFVKDKSANFSDVIEPDAINIIDYLEVQDNFWLVGRYIREIRDTLKGGVAIIILQKGEGSKLPIGKEFSRHLARCVVTIDKGVLTIIKAKDRAQKTVNPVNKKWGFTIDDTGTKFLNIREIKGERLDY